MLKRILMSGGAIVFIGALLYGATGAFFSDTETSTGNTFSAGAIDLQIDNTSYGFDWNDPTEDEPTGVWGPNEANSWELSDLTNQLFFSFTDLKPGDYGEDTISLHVNDNDAWACMAFELTGTPENGQNEPEAAVDQTAGANEGELQNYVSFLFWNDDGDNVLETGEDVIEELSGLSSEIFDGAWLPIAESGDTPLPGDTTQYVGKGWCFGDINAAPVAPAANPNGPTVGNTGFTCDGNGEEDQNDAQTDGLVVDVGFYAVQSRNNPNFTCAGLPPFDGEEPVGTLVGSNFALREPSGSCDVTVGATSTQTTIAAGIAAADPGETVCVNPGTYAESVDLNKTGIKLVATGGPGVTTINGGVNVNANNTIVSGFRVTPAAIGIGPTIASFFVQDVADNASILDNDIDGTGVSNAGGTRGIIMAEGGTFTNVLIQNNSIHDFTSAIYVSTISGAGEPITVKWNDIEVDNPADNGAGGAAGIGQLNDAHVTLNHFTSEVAGGEAVGAASDYDGGAVDLNNFLNGSMLNTYGALVPDVSAENNFWGPSGGAAQTGGTDEVDFTPEAGAQYGHR